MHFYLFDYPPHEAQGGFEDLVEHSSTLGELIDRERGEVWAILRTGKPVKVAEWREEPFTHWVAGEPIEYPPGWYKIKSGPTLLIKRLGDKEERAWQQIADRENKRG